MLEPNTLLQNRYLIGRHIGQGGMGAVYEARDQRLGNAVALKQTLLGGEQFSKAFEREARLLAGLRHPALPRVSDHFNDVDGQFLVMEFIPGADLATMLDQRGGPFPLDQVLGWADQLLDALDYLHTQQPPVIHRDIKPQNLKLTARGEIILLDFGLAKGLNMALTQPDSAVSIFGYTAQYAPLEQIQGTGTDPRSDLYSLAATLYHLLTGTLPANALARATAIVNRQPDPLRPVHEVAPLVPPAVGAALMQALALGPGERPASAAALRTMLRAAPAAPESPIHSRDTVVVARPPATVVAPPPSAGATPARQEGRRGRPWLWALGGGAVVVLALAGLLALRDGRGAGRVGLPAARTVTAQAQAATLVPVVAATAATPPTPLAPTIAPTIAPTDPPPTVPPATSAPTPSASPAPEVPGLAAGQSARTRPEVALDLWAAQAGGARVFERPRLYGGALVTILAVEPAAVRVRTPEGLEGWIRVPVAEALTDDLAAQGEEARFGVGALVEIVWPNGIPLRQEPRINAAKLIEKMPAGQRGNVQEALGDWLKVTLEGGTTGWARWYYDGERYINLAVEEPGQSPRFTRLLSLERPRMSGPDIRAVQRRLLNLGYAEVGQIDGVFGPETEVAVKNFQSANQLDVDGIVGPQTWEKLFGDAVRKPGE